MKLDTAMILFIRPVDGNGRTLVVLLTEAQFRPLDVLSLSYCNVC